jgi:hypothetical protein
MDKKIAGLLGAVAGLATLGAAQAAPNPTEALHVSSYADLLAPISNATELLKANDAAPAKNAAAEPLLAQYSYPPSYYYRHYTHHHHHHHHHRSDRY